MNLLPRGQVVDDLREKIKTYIDRVNDRGFSRGYGKKPSQSTEAHAYIELTKALLHAIPFDWKTDPPTVEDDYMVIYEYLKTGERFMQPMQYSNNPQVKGWWSDDGGSKLDDRYYRVVAWSPMPSSKELGGRE